MWHVIEDMLPDEIFLKRIYKKNFGKKLDLENPLTFNEKLQWLKLNDRNPIYTTMVDKYKVKKYVANIIGEKYIIPTLGVWDRPEEIDFSKLPDRFVLKCNHNSGKGICICKDKSKLDINSVKRNLSKGLAQDYFFVGREWPYKNVTRKIIAEEYMEDKEGAGVLSDYKFHCFHGKPDDVMVCCERNTGTTKFYFFDMNWNLKRYNGWGINAPKDFTLPKPECFMEMVSLVKILCKELPFVRVDMYNINEHPYFGELTFYPQSGFDKNLLPTTDAYFGNLLDLSKVNVRK